ncbi:unnamed protein product [Scytosiphon promiscuus]
MTNVARLSSSRRVSLSENSYGAGGGSAWGGGSGGGSGSGTNGAEPSPASSPPPPPPPTITTSSPSPLPTSRAGGTVHRHGDVEDEGQERAAPFSGELLGGGGEGGSGSNSEGVAGEDSHGKTVDSAGGNDKVGDGDGASGASDDGSRADGGGDGGYGGSGGGGGGGRGKRPASAMGLASKDVGEPPLQSRRISPEEELPRDYTEPSTDTTVKVGVQSPPTPPSSRSGNPPERDEVNNDTKNNQIAPGAWQPRASQQQQQQQQSQQKQAEMAGSSLGAKEERGMAAGMSGATGVAVRSVGTGKGGVWGAGVGKEAAAAMQQPWGVCER